MEIHKIKTFRILTVLIIGLLLPNISNAKTSQNEHKITVISTNSIFADMVKQIGGTEISVTSIVGPDQDMHNYMPKPNDIKKLLSADLVVANGLNFDNWVNRVKKDINIIFLTDGISFIKHDEEIDPHCWNSPNNGLIYIENIVKGLCSIKNDKCNYFKENASKYSEKISNIYNIYKNKFEKLNDNQRKILTSHDAFNYLAKDFNLKFISISSVNEHNEISAKQLAQIIETVKKEKIKTIFLENASNSKFTNKIIEETDIKIGGSLYSDALTKDETGNSYIKLLEHNLDTIFNSVKD